MNDMLEAISADIVGIIGGAPITIRVRAFVVDGKIKAVRSAHPIDANGKWLPRIDDGRATLDTLENESY